MRRRRILLQSVLALALALQAAAAFAQQPARAVDVCNLPPAPGSGRTAAAIVRTACQEHRQWWQSFIDSDGRLVSLGVTEAERTRLFDDVTPAWRQVVRYWRESGTLSMLASTPGASSCQYPGGGRAVDSDCRAFIVDNPWSAAFISWVMARAPLHGFTGSARHIDYIARAWRQPASSPYVYADPFIGTPAPGDLLCYLRADDDGVGPAGLRAALSGSGRLPTRSHCEVVVAANPGGDQTLYLIGGNVLNAVVMRKLPLDRYGRLQREAVGIATVGAATAPVATAARPARPSAPAATAPDDTAAEDSSAPLDAADCGPGNAAACSFNRRDWAVLLRLRSQAELDAFNPALQAVPAAAALPGAPGSQAYAPAPVPAQQAAPVPAAPAAATPAVGPAPAVQAPPAPAPETKSRRKRR